jgi:hypothetical protein
MSTRRYRWQGTAPTNLNNIIEAGAGATLDFLQRTPWTEITVVDGTRDVDLDDYMAAQGYVFDTTGPTVVVTAAGPYLVGTEQVVLVDATLGAITVTMPLTTTRFGNDIQVQKIDGSANAVTVSRSGAETIDGLVSQTLALQGDALWLVADSTNTEWQINQSRRAEDITFDNTGLILTADNVQDAISDIVTGNVTSIQVFTSGEALTTGDLLTLDTAGDVVRAVSSIGSANYEVIGVSNQTVGAAVLVQVVTHTGALPNVRFTAPPAAAFNGRLVFLSTSTGLASTTPPGVGGNAIFTIGTLQGANGITSSPTVVFRPQLIALRS